MNSLKTKSCYGKRKSYRKRKSCKKRKSCRKRKSDGMIEYNKEGKLNNIDDGKNVFRKYIHDSIELKAARIIMENPHPNIVKVLDVNDKEGYYDTEILITDGKVDLFCLKSAKEHLYKLGIVYLDWKSDNIGVGEDGNTKVFDFDMIGLFKGDNFIEKAKNIGFLERYALKILSVISDAKRTPINIGNIIFENMLFTEQFDIEYYTRMSP